MELKIWTVSREGKDYGPTEGQAKLLKTKAKRINLIGDCRVGKTTALIALVLHEALTKPKSVIGVSYNMTALFERSFMAELKQRISNEDWNNFIVRKPTVHDRKLRFKNGSTIIFMNFGSDVSNYTLRGIRFDLLILTEFVVLSGKTEMQSYRNYLLEALQRSKRVILDNHPKPDSRLKLRFRRLELDSNPHIPEDYARSCKST